MAIKRLNYFNGEFLKESDFTDEQQYHLKMRRWHNQYLHSAGIAFGLKVTAGTNAVTIDPGMAIDAQGQEIVVEKQLPVPVTTAPAAIVISYSEKQTDETSETGVKGNRRWEENADPTSIAIGSIDATKHVVLAKVMTIGAAGEITLDATFRPTYSAPTVRGDLAVQRDLTVQGNLTVQGETTTISTESMRGNVTLGDEDTDTVTIEGRLVTGHSSGRLQIESPVQVTGDVILTGALTLPGNPTLALQAATKQYIDSHTSQANPHSGSLSKTGDTMSGALSITAAGTGLNVTNSASLGGSLTVGGNVGVGTSTPTRKIQTQTAINEYSYSQTDGTIELATFLNGGFQSGMIGTVTNHPFQIYTSNSGPVMTLTTGGTSGNVGIGTLTPTQKLEVVGTVKATALECVGTSPAVRIADGTQALGRILVSDALGNASWKDTSRYLVSGNLNTVSGTATSTFSKLGDFVTFKKLAAESTIEVHMHTRADPGTFSAAAGVHFQVRIDNIATSIGNDATITSSNSVQFLSIYAIFQSLAAGAHTLSVWIRTNAGTSSVIMLDPGGWGGRIIVKETF